MNKIEKGLQVLMILVVVLMVVIFFASIMIGHATDYNFLFGLEHAPEIGKTLVTNSNFI